GPVLFGIDLDVGPAELIALVGANGAGKSTFLGVVSGLVRASSGTITLAGEDVTNVRPEALVRKGVAHGPQGRRLFGTISAAREPRSSWWSRTCWSRWTWRTAPTCWRTGRSP